MYVQLCLGEEDFIRKLGVTDVSENCRAAKKFDVLGYADADGLVAMKEGIQSRGFVLRGLDLHSWSWIDEVAGQDIAQQETDRVCRTIEAMGKAGIDTLIMPCSRKSLTPLSSSEKRNFHESVVGIHRQLSKVAEHSGVKLAFHTTLMPDIMINDADSLDNFLEDVGSLANGLILCMGSVSLAGFRIEDFIDRYRDIIYLVHVKNPIGAWEKFEEARFDEGQINIPSVFGYLSKQGYNGGIIPEHFPAIGDDQKTAKAWAVAYLKGVCDALKA